MGSRNLESTSSQHRGGGDGDLLDSWKEIARYLRRTVRTVQRWEKTEGLPVHRHEHLDRPTVYAFKREIDSWQDSRDGFPENGTRRKSRRWLILAVASAILVAVAAAVLSRHPAPDPIVDAPKFEGPRSVLITDFENRTGDSRLDGALEFALHRELTGSPVLAAVPLARVLDTLRLMERPMDSPIDATIGGEICLRDGDIPLLIRGRIDQLGGSYSIGIQLIDSASGSIEAAVREERLAESELLTAIDRLARRVQAAASGLIADATPREQLPPRVTTSSLRALQLYARADRVFVEDNLNSLTVNEPRDRSDVAARLLREAIFADPEFASAHVHLGWAVMRQTRDAGKALPHMNRALAFLARASEAERLFIQGSIAGLKGDHEAAISNYQALLEIDPGHFWAVNNLRYHYFQTRRPLDWAGAWERFASILPRNREVQATAARWIGTIRGIEFAWPYYQRARSAAGGLPDGIEPWLKARLSSFPGWKAWLENDPERAVSVAEEMHSWCETLAAGEERDALAWEAWKLEGALGERGVDRWKGFVSDPHARLMMEIWKASWSRDRVTFPKEFARLIASLGEEEPLPAGMEALLPAATYFGLVDEVDRLLTERAHPRWRELVEPFVLFQRGELEDGAMGLERLVAQPTTGYHALYFQAVATLAELREREGDTAGALRVLEEAAARRSAAAGSGAGRLWVRNQVLLAERYRRLGQPDRADAIETELRRLLILADDDDPLLGARPNEESQSPTSSS